MVCLAERLAHSKCRADLVSGRDGGERAFPTVGAREGLHGLSLEDVGSSLPPPWSLGTLCDVSLALLGHARPSARLGPQLPSLALGWGPPACPSCTVMSPALARPAGPVCVCGHSCVCSARVRLPGTDSSCSGAAGNGYEAAGAGGVGVAWRPAGLHVHHSGSLPTYPPLAFRGHINHGDTLRPPGGACYLSDFRVSVRWSQITATQAGSSLGESVLDGPASTREAEIAPSQYSMLCARGVPGPAPPPPELALLRRGPAP